MKQSIILVLAAANLIGAATAFSEGLTLDQYFAEKKEYNKKIGREFDQEKYTKLFAKLDRNSDGLLTDEERNPPKKTVKASYPEAEKNPAWFVESMKTRDQRLEWYKEAKFGMFVHWGVYSLLAGEWNGEVATGYSEHILRSHQIPLAEYASEVAAKFNPVQFNADEWIRLCKAAGMKYFVITSKHHDGLAMWPSDVNEWDIADATPFDRDPMMELRDACKKYGITFGFYYSQAQDWSHPGGQRNTWDFPGMPTQRSQWFNDPKYADHIARSEQYIKEKSIPQLLEIVERYKPEIIWFDTSGWVPLYQNQMVLKAMREVVPDIVVNSRIGYGLGDYASTCDQPDDIQPYQKKHDVWEGIPTTNLSYGYHAKDKSHKPVSFFIELLAKTAERGGNMLMNIGPMGNGLIAPEDVEILTGIGKWMDVNGEAIYGTTHTPLPPQTFGHVSRKGNKLYLHVTRWPKDGKVTLAGLKTPITKAWLLADQQPLAVSSAGSNDWKIQGPEKAPDPVNTVIVVETDGEPTGIKDDETMLLVSNLRNQRLHAFESKVEGGLKWGHGSPRDNGITGWNKQAMSTGRATWTIRVEEPLGFTLDLIYVAVEGKHGGSYTVSVGDQKFTAEVETQQKPDHDKKVKYIPHTLGTIKLEPGTHQISIVGEELTGKELFMPSSIILSHK
ncbi:alpha-L-fucosidase [Pontiellaceae bacterium B12227]|nr:alpha-L-fucosidase [Pontiellaceae bacterium B12227]